MAHNYVSSEGIEAASENPFVMDLLKAREVGDKVQIIKGRRGWATKAAHLLDPETGEVLSDSLCLSHKTSVDRGKFVKIFVAGLQATFDLSKRAREALTAILQYHGTEATCGPTQRNDIIVFPYLVAQETAWSPSRQVYRSAMNELCLKKFLCPVAGTVDWFWTNPTFFHKGDRLVIINHFVTGEAAKASIPAKAGGCAELDQLGFDGLTERERRANHSDKMPEITPPQDIDRGPGRPALLDRAADD